MLGSFSVFEVLTPGPGEAAPDAFVRWCAPIAVVVVLLAAISARRWASTHGGTRTLDVGASTDREHGGPA